MPPAPNASGSALMDQLMRSSPAIFRPRPGELVEGTVVFKGKNKLLLDIRGVSCPGPIVEAKKLLDAMQPGEILQLISSCPGSPSDVRAWIKSTGLELVAARDSARDVHEFFIRKKK